ncbi:hypothetical protein TNCV_2958951 [Trichonephila clavipes]|nr:hypothetical protein TNCV_2958951 [Trichonephila clavipes]
MMTDRDPRNSLQQRVRCTPVVSRNLEHETGDNTFWHGSTPIFEEQHLGVVRDLLLLFPFHHLMKRLVSRWLIRVGPCRKGTAHLQTAISRIQTQALRHSSQRR